MSAVGTNFTHLYKIATLFNHGKKTHQVYDIIYNKDKNTKQLQTKHILLSMSAVGTNFTHLYKIASFELLESNSLSDMNR